MRPIIVFQSTRPVWGATAADVGRQFWITISIHAPRMGRDAVRIDLDHRIMISIHAPRMGRDYILKLFLLIKH